uniref:Protein odr-4 homolog n=1 Tax=Poecilia latipinna TaxID=48699 RepID=A0A3B3VZR4_9TELE
MGRSYIVEDDVEGYLSRLCSQLAGPVTGLLIGQSTVQRDFVVMTTRTPQNDESADGGKSVDKEWVSEHARQVSRMLPGGLSVLGVFIISESDAKDTLTTLRQLVFSVENLISSERLWTPADDDVTDCVTLHVNPKTRKTVCRTFDVKDPKSVAKPADWKYQSGVCSSWATVSSSCLFQEELKVWAQQIERGVCLIDGKKLPEDSELKAGQVDVQTAADVVQRCGGCVSVRGAIHSRAFLHSNKPKAKLAEKQLLKRDIVSTVATRVQMLLEEPQKQNEENKEQSCLPRRVFCPVKSTGPLSVCDYQFSDEGLSEMTDRFKEMLDMDAAEEDLDATCEIIAEVIESEATEGTNNKWIAALTFQNPPPPPCLGVAMATAVALLALAASIMYLSDV